MDYDKSEYFTVQSEGTYNGVSKKDRKNKDGKITSVNYFLHLKMVGGEIKLGVSSQVFSEFKSKESTFSLVKSGFNEQGFPCSGTKVECISVSATRLLTEHKSFDGNSYTTNSYILSDPMLLSWKTLLRADSVKQSIK